MVNLNPDGIGVAIYDRNTETYCAYNDTGTFFTASIVKVVLVGTLLRLAEDEGRELTTDEHNLAYAAITSSDNDAATAIQDIVGNDRIAAFLSAVGMSGTVVDSSWGNAITTAADQITLLRMLNTSGEVLTDAHRTYVLDLMAQVVSDQHWGAPAGAPGTLTWHVKNGWYPTDGWVNSIASFNGLGQQYDIAILTGNSYDLTAGIKRIAGIARVVHRALEPFDPTWRTLSEGAQGVRVKTLQHLLNAEGAGLDADGIFGPLTQEAVTAFQSAQGLDADGIVGPLTWSALVGRLAAGDSGDAVRGVQEELVSGGFDVAVSGQFDDATVVAVRSFEQWRGLTVDGVVDERTWEALVT